MKPTSILVPLLALAGAVVGFLLRPANVLGRQLPLSTVLTRGATLHGLDRLLVPLARESFNDVLAGAVCGLVVGLIVAVLAKRG